MIRFAAFTLPLFASFYTLAASPKPVQAKPAAEAPMSLSRAEYEAYTLKKIESLTCPLKEYPSTVRFSTDDGGSTYNLRVVSGTGAGRTLFSGLKCRNGNTRWSLGCKNAEGNVVLHLDGTGIYRSPRADETEGDYDHNVAFTSDRRYVKSTSSTSGLVEEGTISGSAWGSNCELTHLQN